MLAPPDASPSKRWVGACLGRSLRDGGVVGLMPGLVELPQPHNFLDHAEPDPAGEPGRSGLAHAGCCRDCPQGWWDREVS